MKRKIGIVSLGCPKNLVDSEVMLGILKKNEYEITNQKEDAEIIIVNTCGFIDSAKEESINTILEMAQLKKDNCKFLIVTGCMAERYNNQILNEIPEVDAVIGTGSYGKIAEVIEKAYNGQKTVMYGKLDEIDYLNENRILSTNKGYAYLKIAEGCNNNCTYCIIPTLRGPYRSRKIYELYSEAEKLAKSGVSELILVAQDITRYGTDLYEKRSLVDLIKKISQIDEVKWIRLLYCYPEEIDEELINEIKLNPKVCKYLDIPIQHASDRILKLMGRRGTNKQITELLKNLREKIPGLIIRSSLIVGFPGENQQDFNILKDFVKESHIDRLGVFTYSREEGTKAAGMTNQVPKKIKNQRFEELMQEQMHINSNNNMQRVGKVFETIVQGVADDGIFYYGRSYAEAPDIDNLIYFTSKEPLNDGEFVKVKILAIDQYDLIGEVIDR